MLVLCHTNLDLIKQAEKWPTDLPCLPNIGDRIVSNYHWEYLTGDRQLTLEVVAISWHFCKEDFITRQKDFWMPHIELHLPKSRYTSLTHFYEWYGQITGKGKSYF